MNKIQIYDWKWHGLPGHFICSNRCIFRLHTTIGKWKISTVGAMYGENKNGVKVLETIGFKRHYETMVFDNEREELLNIDMDTIYCGDNVTSSSELWDKKAEEMHLEMCHKWACR